MHDLIGGTCSGGNSRLGVFGDCCVSSLIFHALTFPKPNAKKKDNKRDEHIPKTVTAICVRDSVRGE